MGLNVTLDGVPQRPVLILRLASLQLPPVSLSQFKLAVSCGWGLKTLESRKICWLVQPNDYRKFEPMTKFRS